MINITEDLIWELQDQVQELRRELRRADLKVSRLCEQAGINPAEAGRLPDEAPPEAA
jgi:hypothetical protein